MVTKLPLPSFLYQSMNTTYNMFIHKPDIANELAIYWSTNSSDDNFPPIFRTKICNLEINFSNISPNMKDIREREQDIKEIEFNTTLNRLKGKSAWLDRLSYAMM